LCVWAAAALAAGPAAFVTNEADNSVSPINLANSVAGTAIHVGMAPSGVAITPSGATAYVANEDDDTVTPINLATGTTAPTIAVGDAPTAIAITPDGRTALVADSGDQSVTRIDLSNNQPGPAIAVGHGPSAIAITPPGPPTARIDLFAADTSFLVHQRVSTKFSCTEGAGGPGLASCRDSNGASGPGGGVGMLDTRAAGHYRYTVTATSKDGQTGTDGFTYTVINSPPQPKPPQNKPLKISRISVDRHTITWCFGPKRCPYPMARLRYALTKRTTLRLVLRRKIDGRFKRVAIATVPGHSGYNRRRVSGRWHGKLVPKGKVHLLVQIRPGTHWKTAKTIGLTVRHAQTH
jgi:YVTN family beta-propeller protein